MHTYDTPTHMKIIVSIWIHLTGSVVFNRLGIFGYHLRVSRVHGRSPLLKTALSAAESAWIDSGSFDMTLEIDECQRDTVCVHVVLRLQWHCRIGPARSRKVPPQRPAVTREIWPASDNTLTSSTEFKRPHFRSMCRSSNTTHHESILLKVRRKTVHVRLGSSKIGPVFLATAVRQADTNG